jgi:hypothetical protein
MDKQYYLCFNDPRPGPNLTVADMCQSQLLGQFLFSIPQYYDKNFTFCLNSFNTILEDLRLPLNVFECIFSHHWA